MAKAPAIGEDRATLKLVEMFAAAILVVTVRRRRYRDGLSAQPHGVGQGPKMAELLPMIIVTYVPPAEAGAEAQGAGRRTERAGDRACGEEGPSCRRHRRR